MENQKLSIKNYAVIKLGHWLNNQLLIGSESRFRSRFINLLKERMVEIESERIKICEQYAEKDADGNFVFYTEDGGKGEKTTKEIGRYNITDEKAFTDALREYMNEDLIIDVTQANIGCILGVRQVLLNTKCVFAGDDADTYDVWCLALEAIA